MRPPDWHMALLTAKPGAACARLHLKTQNMILLSPDSGDTNPHQGRRDR